MQTIRSRSILEGKSKNFLWIALFSFLIVEIHIHATTHSRAKTDSIGNILISWEDSRPTDPDTCIRARYYDATTQTWSPTTVISGTETSIRRPEVAINDLQHTIVIWRGTDPAFNKRAIYAATYDVLTNTWSTPPKKISSASEQVLEPYAVFLSGNDMLTITWQAILSGETVVRAVMAPFSDFSTLPPPDTISQ